METIQLKIGKIRLSYPYTDEKGEVCGGVSIERFETWAGSTLLGAFSEPICGGSRALLKRGLASPEDRVETWRGDTLCLSSTVGEAAKWMVVDPLNGLKSAHWGPYQEFPSENFKPRAKP